MATSGPTPGTTAGGAEQGAVEATGGEQAVGCCRARQHDAGFFGDLALAAFGFGDRLLVGDGRPRRRGLGAPRRLIEGGHPGITVGEVEMGAVGLARLHRPPVVVTGEAFSLQRIEVGRAPLDRLGGRGDGALGAVLGSRSAPARCRSAVSTAAARRLSTVRV